MRREQAATSEDSSLDELKALIAKTKSKKYKKLLTDILEGYPRARAKPTFTLATVVSESDLKKGDQDRVEKRAADIKKYGVPYPVALDQVTLKNDRVTPQRPLWWVGDSDESKGEVHIWKAVYAGGGVYPDSLSGYGVVSKTVSIKDIATVQ